MKFMPGPFIGNASGSVGGQVASRNRYGAYFRTRAIPVTSTTPAALNAKARFTTASQAWIALTEGQRLAWKEWALDNPVIDRLGQQQELQGNAAYIQINARLAAIGTAPIVAPPVAAAPTGLLTLAQTCDIGTGNFELVFTATPTGAGVLLYIQSAIVNSGGINYVSNKLRLIGVSGAAEASPFDHQTLLEARFGTAVVNQWVHSLVSTVDTTTGLLSGALSVKTQVIDTP